MPSSRSARTVSAPSRRKSKEDGGQLSFWGTEVEGEETPEKKRITRKKARAVKVEARVEVPRLAVVDPEVSRLVGREILQGRLNPAEWAVALATSQGGREEAESHYARLRMESLADEARIRRERERALENRRSLGFRKMSEEMALSVRPNRRKEVRAFSFFWIGCLVLSMTGVLACVARLVEMQGWRELGWVHHIAIAVMVGVVVMAADFALPKFRPMLRMGLPLVVSGLAFLSFGAGVKLMAQTGFAKSEVAQEGLRESAKRVVANTQVLEKKEPRREGKEEERGIATNPSR